MTGKRMKNLVPFLKKTYEMVEDPNTNELISWNYQNKTFTIWDHNKFSSTLLPTKFTHDNISSFVYQLNNYGFRKVNNNPWEYYNQWFQPGREDLLYNIKRRSQNPKNKKRKEEETDTSQQAMIEFGNLVTEIATLKDSHKKLKVEVSDLRREHEKLEKQLIQVSEFGEEDVAELVLKALSNPSFVQKIKERYEHMSLQVPLEEEPNLEDSEMTLQNLNSRSCFALEKGIAHSGQKVLNLKDKTRIEKKDEEDK